MKVPSDSTTSSQACPDARVPSIKRKLLIANRGEIALRIARAAEESGLLTVAIYSQDDAQSLHRFAADEAVALDGSGAAAYLDMDAIVKVALQSGCTLLHPGYGFLSENASFASACEQAGVCFVGPSPKVLELFGDKAVARAFAKSHGVPLAKGTSEATSPQEMKAFFESLPGSSRAMIKAMSGGGGRGMREVSSLEQLDAAFARCSSEASKAFGNASLYIEQYVSGARHVEVQIAGDGCQAVHLGERDCSVQQRHQKLVEIAPAPNLKERERQMLREVSIKMAEACELRGLCTFEFLVSAELESGFVFMEANPRLQVEHTVTEEVYGVDLVRAQIALAQGGTLESAGLSQTGVGEPRGYAIQYRINMDMSAPGADRGAVTHLQLPTGRGIRVETFVCQGAQPSRNFDPLLAKLVVHSHAPEFEVALEKGLRALAQFRLDGIPTNVALLEAIGSDSIFRTQTTTTRFVEENLDRLNEAARTRLAERARDSAALVPVDAQPVDSGFDLGEADAGTVRSSLRGSVLELGVEPGAVVRRGATLCVLEAMKMEHVIEAPYDARVVNVHVVKGELISAGYVMFSLEPADAGDDGASDAVAGNTSGQLRENLREVMALRQLRADEGRQEATERRHAMGFRTARENLQDLCDPDSFREYGAAAVGARHSTTPLDELQRKSPADGFIYGMASINGHLFDAERSRCMVATYDYTVHAGTQGFYSHKKHDRLFHLAEVARRPVVIFTEGGGGRPTEPDNVGGANLASHTFFAFARLSGLVPLVGVAAGRCFAGNAALLGCCDVVIATRGSTIGMGGPVMIEGAGLGVYKPEEVGPAAMHASKGVVDILVDDEAQAVRVAKKYLGYFQGPLRDWTVPDQTELRDIIPERRTRSYDVRRVIAALADEDSVLELRAEFGLGAITALVRIEGKPVGLIANNPAYNAGAICSDEADKFTRFIKLCDAHGLPIVSLCDTPGIMVGPEAEKTAIVRHSSRMMVAAANISVPYFTVVLRKGYGLGAMAMAGGSLHLGSFFSIAWPTAEFGGMGLEGQVRLGHRRELEAIADPGQRAERFNHLVDKLYQHGKATNYAPFLVIDEVIDPVETRSWLLAGLLTVRARGERPAHKHQPGLDAW